MNGLEDRLTNDLTGLADAAEFRPESAAGVVASGRRRKHRRRVGRLILMAAAAVVVVVGATTLAVRNADDVQTGDDLNPTVTVAPTTTPTALPAGGEIVMAGDGLGRVEFGDAFGPVLAAMEAEFGPAQLGDVGLLGDCEGPDGQCEPQWYEECSSQGPHRVERTANWEGLMLIFRGADEQSLEFRAWSADAASTLETPEGLRVADNPLAWKGTYGDRISFKSIQGDGLQAVTLDGAITGYATPNMMSSMAAGFFCAQGDF